jgi:hypothetical protein
LAGVTISIILLASFSIGEFGLLSTFTLRDFVIAAILGFALDGIGYMTWTRANWLVREGDSGISIASIASLMYILPVLSLLIIVILLGETSLFQAYFVASLVLVIVSAVVCQKADQVGGRFSRRNSERE